MMTVQALSISICFPPNWNVFSKEKKRINGFGKYSDNRPGSNHALLLYISLQGNLRQKEPLILTFFANLSNRTKPNYRTEFCPSHIIHCANFTLLCTSTAVRYGKGY